MTKEEAWAVLERSEDMIPWTDDQGVTWHHHVGGFFKEFPNSYSFVVYPYSSKEPLDPLYAFLYFVRKSTGDVVRSDSPMPEHELRKLGGK